MTKERLTEEQIEAVEQEYNLPVLETGTEKQVAWARAIRAEKLTEYAGRKEREGSPYHNFWTPAEKDAAWNQTLVSARSHMTARWWIDHRDSERFLAALCDALHPLLLELKDERKRVRAQERAQKFLAAGIEREKENHIEHGGILLRGYGYNYLDHAYRIPVEKELNVDEANALVRDGATEEKRVDYYCLYIQGTPRYILVAYKGNNVVYDLKEEKIL